MTMDPPVIPKHDLSRLNESVYKNPDGSMKMRTIALLQCMAFIGLNEIKDTNIAEFFLRVRLLESICGALLLTPEGVPCPTLLPDVQDHVGLKAHDINNVSTMDYWREHIANLEIQFPGIKKDEARIIVAG